MPWYAAHVVVSVRFKDGIQDTYPLWENVVLLQAISDEEAEAKAPRPAERSTKAMTRLIRVSRISGVAVYVHGSTLVVAALILISALQRPLATLCGLAAYAGVLLLHEWGHAAMARRRGHAVWSIEIYPIHGVTRCEAPGSLWDRCLIAWGGVLAQAAIAIPLIAWVVVFGYTPYEPINAVIAMLGFFSLAVAVLNLLPIPHLDGSQTWQIVPLLFDRVRARRARRVRAWKSLR